MKRFRVSIDTTGFEEAESEPQAIQQFLDNLTAEDCFCECEDEDEEEEEVTEHDKSR